MNSKRNLPGMLVLVLVAGSAVAADADRAEELFVLRIAPLLQEKCWACHGADERSREGGLDLSARTGLLKGGDSEEPAIVPGQPDDSPLYRAVTRTDDAWSAMPPKEANQLTAEEVAWIRQWIAAGAPWPDEQRIQQLAGDREPSWSVEDGVTVVTSGGLSPEWTQRKYKPEGLWAYQPVKKPDTRQAGSAAIDELIGARLPEGVEPAPRADRRTLIRRATFDLTGLPPTPAEIESFLADPQPDQAAFAEVVERLLASPHYGERMAQHWLDVVRYADSAGFANDYERGNAWRYRDYVVRAFNNDKPYDQFVREQIAGDEIDPSDPELLVATGFLRMGPWELTAMEVPKVARQRFLDDVTNSAGETFLAHSLQCARCHDHKFDPVPTRDYYGVQAVFATTQLAERSAPFLPVENTAGFEEKKYAEAREQDYLRSLRALDEAMLVNAQQWFVDRGTDPGQWNAAIAAVRTRPPSKNARAALSIFEQARSLLIRQGVPESEFPPKFVGFTPEQYGLERVARKGLERVRWELIRYEPLALAVYSGPTRSVASVTAPVRMPADPLQDGELEQTCILAGGDPFSPTITVKPSVLSVLGHVQKSKIPTDIAGRRQALAEWVACADNPLTTRTIVNRVWLWHFGRAIAGNPNNFGSTGQRPTHPELLDWLAATLVEEGWSFKTLHRLIMNSETYCRSSTHADRAGVAAKDPPGTSYAVFQPRRLSAEELRDAMLAVTGELNRTLGGIPARPEINLEAALQPRQVMGTFAAAWTPNPLPAQRHRRSLYALKLRGLVDPMLEVFNAPAADFSCERREASTVTPQVFSLFNSHASYSRALALAQRVLPRAEPDEETLRQCFLLTYGRRPSEAELSMCSAHWREMTRRHAATRHAPRTYPLQVRREAVEENTGEKFTFVEKLHAYADFVPDLQPADCNARTRALADVCLALFNSNEFVYVY